MQTKKTTFHILQTKDIVHSQYFNSNPRLSSLILQDKLRNPSLWIQNKHSIDKPLLHSNHLQEPDIGDYTFQLDTSNL